MIIYTDGACSGNPGPGGFGVVVLDDDENLILTHNESSDNTTNNREELKAILWAFLKYGTLADSEDIPPVIYTDSAYCINVFTEWMFSWEKRTWVKIDNKKPENLNLIVPFFNHWRDGYRVELRKIQGHSTNKWNNLADSLAKQSLVIRKKI